MVIKRAKDKWAYNSQKALLNVCQGCDSYAAIEGARMSAGDREAVRNYIEQALQILSKY